MRIIGLDIGSRTVKRVTLVDGDVADHTVVPNNHDPLTVCDELLDNIVDRYFTIDCAVFTPNPTRAEHALEIGRDAKADGVIHYALQFCSPYQMEAPLVERRVEHGGLPVLRIDTDYSQEDVGQLQTRVEAFVEQIRR